MSFDPNDPLVAELMSLRSRLQARQPDAHATRVVTRPPFAKRPVEGLPDVKGEGGGGHRPMVLKVHRLRQPGQFLDHLCVGCSEPITSGKIIVSEIQGVYLDRNRWFPYHYDCHPSQVDRRFEQLRRSLEGSWPISGRS